jgi:hypothetical protein
MQLLESKSPVTGRVLSFCFTISHRTTVVYLYITLCQEVHLAQPQRLLTTMNMPQLFSGKGMDKCSHMYSQSCIYSIDASLACFSPSVSRRIQKAWGTCQFHTLSVIASSVSPSHQPGMAERWLVRRQTFTNPSFSFVVVQMILG